VVAAAVAAAAQVPARAPERLRVPEPRSEAPDVKQARAGVRRPQVAGREPVLGPAQVPQPGVVPERRVATLPARPEALQMSGRSPTAAR